MTAQRFADQLASKMFAAAKTPTLHIDRAGLIALALGCFKAGELAGADNAWLKHREEFIRALAAQPPAENPRP